MEEVAGFSLNCTANDVQVANALNIVILDDGCAFPGDEVTFTANFEVVLTAQARHDIGIYFATDGDPNGDAAETGLCTIATVPYAPDPPNLDLDMTNDGGICVGTTDVVCTSDRDCKGVGTGVCGPFQQDTCGDIDDNHNPLFPQITITTECVPGPTGKLLLPNCTSWRQPGANELCTSPFQAFPGAPSKCRCDAGFEVDIDVPASIVVTKTASPTTLSEPGGNVTFTVSVENPATSFSSVTIDSLVDDLYGDLNGQGDCSVPQVLQIGDTYTCSFTIDVVAEPADSPVTDVVTASGINDDTGAPVSDSDDAQVIITDILPMIDVTKEANPDQFNENGADVTYTFTVTNLTVGEDVTLDSLVDSIYGDLNGQGTCSVPQTLAENGGTYSCQITEFVGGNAGFSLLNEVTAQASDDDGNTDTDMASDTVTILDIPSMIEVIKTATPDNVNEPGAPVTFDVTVNNLSAVDTVTLNSLVDDPYGDLNGQGDCSVPQTLPPLGSYSCSFQVLVSGNAGDTLTDTVTATGVDDDGQTVMDDDPATVTIKDVPPAASLTKTATMAEVTFAVTVNNDSSSSSDPVTVTSLNDDKYGDITQVQGAIQSTNCSVPQDIPFGGSYSCSFVATVNSPGETDTVTGMVEDDDGTAVAPDPSDSAAVGLE